MRPEEVPLLVAVLELIQQVVQFNEKKRREFYNHMTWKPLETLFRFFCCPIPSILKAKTLSVLTSFAKSEDIARTIWSFLASCQISAVGQNSFVSGLRAELEENEARAEAYPGTLAFLHLLIQMLDVTGDLEKLHPYLDFLVEVFLKFDTRPYINQSEKYQIAKAVLTIFLKIFELSERIRPSEGRLTNIELRLLQSFLTPSNLSPLHKIIVILENDGINTCIFEAKIDHQILASLETVVLLCLQIFEIVLKNEDKAKVAPFTPASTPLKDSFKLLQSQPRIMPSLVRFVGYVGYSNNKEVSLHAVHVISLCQNQSLLTKYIIDDNNLNAFSERLTDPTKDATYDSQIESYKTKSPRYAILRLLIDNLKQIEPTLAIWLIEGKQRGTGCLSQITSILEDHSSPPPLLEAASHLLFLLAQHKMTSSYVTSQLRTPTTSEDANNTDYFFRHMLSMPFQLGEHAACQLNQEAWFLQTLSIEIHLTQLVSRQRPHLHKLLELLFNPPPQYSSRDQRPKIIQFLDVLYYNLSHDFVGLENITKLSKDELYREVYQPALRRDVDADYSIIDIPTLRHLLRIKLSPNPLISANLEVIIEEVTKQANLMNQARELELAKFNVVNAFNQIIVIVMHKCFEFFKESNRKAGLYELLSTLLDQLEKVENDNFTPSLASSILVIITKLLEEKRSSSKTEKPTLTNLMPRELMIKILKKLTENISKQRSYLLRGSLYASLSNFLRLTQKPQIVEGEKERWWYKTETEDVESQYNQLNLEIVRTLTESRFENIFHDALNSPEYVWKALAFSLLDVLVSFDPNNYLLLITERKGFLNQIISSVSQPEENHPFQNLDSMDMSHLFVYEPKMSYLIHLASTPNGAKSLYNFGIFTELLKCRFINIQDTEDILFQQDDQSVLQRYFQVLLPFLKLVNTLFISLQTSTEVARRVLDVLMHHWGAFTWILRDHHPSVTVSSLNSLIYVSSIFEILVRHHYRLLSEYETHFVGFRLNRVCERLKVLLSAYYKYIPSESTSTSFVMEVNGRSAKRFSLTPEDKIQIEEADLLPLRLIQNILSFVRGPSEGFYFTLFVPHYQGTKANSLGLVIDIFKHSLDTLESGPKYGPTRFVLENSAHVLWKHLDVYAQSSTEQPDPKLIENVKVLFETVATQNDPFLQFISTKIKQICGRALTPKF
eukprot:TRINITY_DN12579_c0_g1_i1.p1 TRINITY_DN12579_c0_g1~~TRINITY_DN12579_c0_g1_i1.p1  ORF type:complete len:1267 (+),score=253.31 TRINITY_DN12579_c0_g1_i1:273-3803(+)